MLYRNINSFLEQRFIEFIRETNLDYKIVKDTLYIYNSCMALEIYALKSEDVIYAGLYDLRNRRWCMDLNIIIGNYLEQNQIQPIYKRNEFSDADKDIASIKNYFYSYLEILQTHLQDILNCDFSKYQKKFSPAMPHQIESLKDYKILR